MAETTAADHAAEAAGMPQLDIATFPNQIFWLSVALVAIFFVLSRVALPRIAGILAQRKGMIEGDLARADALKRKAVEAEAAYEKALSDARAESARIIAATRAEIDAGLAEATRAAEVQIAARAEQSEKRIGEIRASAKESVEAVAKETARAIAAALGAKADGTSIDAAIAARLKG
jgi:F-type H+-transporting ATPase subunit b